AGEVEHGVDEHRPVTGAEDEPVAVRPARVARVEAQVPSPEDVADRRAAHRHSRVAAVRLLDRVDGEEADGMDDLLLQLGVHQGRGGERGGVGEEGCGARAAARSRRASVLVTTCTGICSSWRRIRPLSRNASRKWPSLSWSTIRGAIPPATKTPPVASVLR